MRERLVQQHPDNAQVIDEQLAKLSNVQKITVQDLKSAEESVRKSKKVQSHNESRVDSCRTTGNSAVIKKHEPRGKEYIWDFIGMYDLHKNKLEQQEEFVKAKTNKDRYRAALDAQISENEHRRKWVKQEQQREKMYLQMDLDRQKIEDDRKSKEHSASVQRLQAEGRSIFEKIAQQKQIEREQAAQARQEMLDRVAEEENERDLREKLEQKRLAQRRMETLAHLKQVRQEKIQQKMIDAATDKHLQNVAIAMLDKSEQDRQNAILSRKKKQEAIAGTIGRSLGDKQHEEAALNEARMMEQLKLANIKKDQAEKESKELKRYQQEVVKKTLEEQIQFRSESKRSEREIERLQAALFRQKAEESIAQEKAKQQAAFAQRKKMGELYRNEMALKKAAHKDHYVSPHRVQTELEFNQPKIREMIKNGFANKEELASMLIDTDFDIDQDLK